MGRDKKATQREAIAELLAIFKARMTLYTGVRPEPIRFGAITSHLNCWNSSPSHLRLGYPARRLQILVPGSALIIHFYRYEIFLQVGGIDEKMGG